MWAKFYIKKGRIGLVQQCPCLLPLTPLLFFSIPIIIISNFWENMERTPPPGHFHFITLRYFNAKRFTFRQCIKERCTCISVKYCENAMFFGRAVTITLVKFSHLAQAYIVRAETSSIFDDDDDLSDYYSDDKKTRPTRC